MCLGVSVECSKTMYVCYLPATTSGVTKPLARSTQACQNLDAVDPKSCSQRKTKKQLSFSCIQWEVGRVSASLAEELTRGVFVVELQSIDA